MRDPVKKVVDNIVEIDGVKWVPAPLAAALAMEIENLQAAAVERGWALEQYHQRERDNYVADGQWT